MVDDFYVSVLAGMPFTAWDYNSMGAPTLSTLSHYPLLLWHCDDYSEFLLDDNLSTLISYVISGGKLVVSGWKYPQALPQSFFDQWFNGTVPQNMNNPVLISAQSDFYINLHPDPDKLTPIWNGMLSMAYVFPGANQIIYHAEVLDSLSGHGEPLAVRADNNGTIILLGFPLYYMLETEVQIFLNQVLPQLYPNVAVEEDTEPPVAVSLKCFPNPFSANLKMKIAGNKNTPTTVTIFNLKGQKIRQWQNYTGKEIVWNGLDERHSKVSSGVYFVRLNTNSGSILTKILKLE